MAKFLEYQGKEFFKQSKIPIPEGIVVSTPEDAEAAAQQLARPVVIKAQVHAGGRGKAGGVKFADTPEQAHTLAGEILGMDIKGLEVKQLLVEEQLDIVQEFYAGVIINSAQEVRGPVLMFSPEGGMDIESVSQDKIATMNVDVIKGLMPYDTLNMVASMGVTGKALRQIADIVFKLFKVFQKMDCRSLEINPLVLTSDNKVLAADCRMAVDDQALFRHPELGIKIGREFLKEPTEFDLIGWSFEASDFRGTSYVAEMAAPEEVVKGGYVGYHGIGGGAAMIGMDALNRVGLKIADYADTSGNPTASKVYRTTKLIMSQPGIEAYFLAGFMMANQEQWHHAHGVVKALREELPKKPGFPVVLLLCGNKEKQSQEILKEGLADLDARIEIYDRDRVYDATFIAGRVKALVDEYHEKQSLS
ncbi:MAG: succinyl-CoA synthetase subunit beta [Desulfobacula sp.]|jgi:succinyl-CoA synthetase beta subunit|uniref:ATP-grasp domain-containing protein n=1 Tax=Desulfobacula sp. TaxID=2593537 RepID=UPI001D752B85|nr:succinyl-CoA synthetase subunit beta [Desulfobacula sp.]MBT3483757.1 succinyl-CoA synthetase subunit beta [Desulfobacula sp.]MBT4023260.1 succinyl-CoA synthetase subunit beta [Desulfobacula sp.]MBT4197246.1 succinyl-CoA synthetase subunit beta [Desulfobacula sp.]MBT4504926.1 succinyl-CoA synthetase subunit beta [Desulfobacula sp.]